MTQDEIMAMAKQVGFPIQNPEWQKAAEEFAALIEEKATVKERENWPAEMKAMENQVNILTDEFCNAVKVEREACAQMVEKIETYEKVEKACFKFAAKTIRARGEQHG